MKIKSLVVVSLIAGLLICGYGISVQSQIESEQVLYATTNPSYVYDITLLDWMQYLSDDINVVGYGDLPSNINEYYGVSIVVAHNLGAYSLSVSQKQALKEYVESGGCLFVGGRVDSLTNEWFGTQSLSAMAPSLTVLFPDNNYLNFSDVLDARVGSVLPKFTGYGYFTSEQLPSTIQAVVTSDVGDGLIYAGELGEGKIVLLPNLWFWTYARGYPQIHSPIIVALLKYTLQSDYAFPTGGEVCLRVDDIYGWNSTELHNTVSAFANAGANKITLGVIPTYTPNQELKDELSRLPGCELALHGDSSGHTDSSSYDYATALQRFGAGASMIEANHGVSVNTSLTVYEKQQNNDVLLALKDLGLSISGGGNVSYYLQQIPNGPIDASMQDRFISSDIKSCVEAGYYYMHTYLLRELPTVLFTHPNSDTSALAELLNYLNGLNVEYITISEAVAKYASTQPQPTPTPNPTPTATPQPTPTPTPDPTPEPFIPLTPEEWADYWNWVATQDEEFRSSIEQWRNIG